MNLIKYFALIWIAILMMVPAFSQKAIHVYGFIRDRESNEALPGATLFDSITQTGVIADYNGYYNIKIDVPTDLQVSFVGYAMEKIRIDKPEDTRLDIKLSSSVMLNQVVVSGKRNISGNISGLSGKELTQIPSLGGKPDVIKALQLLPGITTQNEASSLLIVRGGDPGQNLYLFDNVPIIYVNHLGGFMSVFNPEIINNIDVYKGAFPPRYGGKLSSVVDITQKKGDLSGLKGNYSLGLTDLSFCIEGPGITENTSFILAGRKTLTDPMMYAFSTLSAENDFSVAYGFHDLNGKYTWNPNEKNSFDVNLYYGDDYLKYWQNDDIQKNKYANVWGNIMTSAHWNRVINARLFSKVLVSYSNYRLLNRYTYQSKINQVQEDYTGKYFSSVGELATRASLKHTLFKNLFNEYGIDYSLLKFSPFYFTSSNTDQSIRENVFTHTVAGFISTRISFLKYSHIDGGVRGVCFLSDNFTDYSLEPRINLKLGITKSQSFGASFMSTKQYSHLLLTTGSIMMNEIWIPASEDIPSATVSQYTIGYNGDYTGFQVQLDLYIKEMANLATYKEGYTAFEGDVNWASKVEPNGTGLSRGIELTLKKTDGKFTGFVSYALSKAIREYSNINQGNSYLFDFDRTHAFSAFLHYELNDKLDFSLTWIYQTGLPYTPAIGKVYSPTTEGEETSYQEYLIYGERYSERMRNYHRLDIGLNYETRTKRNRKVIWSFSVYNLYNRQNPYYYYFNTNDTGEIIFPETGSETLPLKLYQMSFFPFIPSVSYKVYFEK
ncbi:MAG: TonB-dependent receptor [Bacteroidales bacterium]|nr:TonB-dependent receptor [Bacteroidales bacterium]